MKYRVKKHAVVQPLDESYRLIPLTQRQNAIVDAKDFYWLSQYNWYANLDPGMNKFYAGRHEPGHKPFHTWMHNEVLGLKGKVFADHINGDTLDNRRENLRPCLGKSQNGCNSKKRCNNKSGYIGVSWSQRKKKWVASVKFSGKSYFLGQFSNAKDAALARDAKAKELHGEFVTLNF